MASSTRLNRHGYSRLLVATSHVIVVAGAFRNVPSPMIRAGTCINVNWAYRWRTNALHSSNTEKINGFDKITEGIHTHPIDDIQQTHVPEIERNATDDSINITTTANESGDAPGDKWWNLPMSQRHRSGSPPFIFPWSLWMKIRSSIPHNHDGDGSQPKSDNLKQKSKRRWEIPLTSTPFQGVEDLRSTIAACITAIALYFAIGTLAFPLWLEPSWSLIDSLYYSMVTLATVGYGDVVVSSGSGLRALLAKMFVISFNIYAVCISVSALGIIAKLGLRQERKIMTQAKERARERLIEMFDSDHDDEDARIGDEVDDEDENDGQCKWADRVIDEESKCDPPNEHDPRSTVGALVQALRNNSINFLALTFLAGLLQRVEQWPLIDVLYYWSCTASTIGFGDICPQTQLGRSLAILFIPLSVITLGEVIAGVFAFVTGRIAARAEKDFLRREITLSDLEYLDVDGDGQVCETDFLTFMLVAMQKVDRKTIQDIQRLFHALDAGKDGFLQKEDLITLRQRKRLAKRLKRDMRKNERWFETRLSKSKKGRKWFGLTF